MKNASIVLVALSASLHLLIPASGQAWTGSHGGSGVRCEVPGMPSRLETLDHWEATTRYRIPLLPETTTEAQLLNRVTSLLGLSRSRFVFALQDELRENRRIWRWVAEGSLPINSDIMMDLRPLPPTCRRAQFAVHYGSRLEVDHGLYTKTTSLNRAMLVLHEAIYAVQRRHTPEPSFPDSQLVRELVANLAAATPNESRILFLITRLTPELSY